MVVVVLIVMMEIADSVNEVFFLACCNPSYLRCFLLLFTLLTYFLSAVRFTKAADIQEQV